MFTEKKCSNESRKSLKWVFVIFGNLSKKLVYFWISQQKSVMEGGEAGTFSKVPDWKKLFLLNKTQAKVKQNPGWSQTKPRLPKQRHLQASTEYQGLS